MKSSKKNDIAIITLDREVVFSKFVRPICIGDLNTPVNPGDKVSSSGSVVSSSLALQVVVTGWGRTDMASYAAAGVLQHVWLGRRQILIHDT